MKDYVSNSICWTVWREHNVNKLSFICDVQNILLVCDKITKFNKVNIKRMEYVAIN